MTEVWISGKKKFCEICKVWFADNKISVENHERGDKHKAMVQKRLREMSQNAAKRDAEAGHQNAVLIAMEQAALAAMKRDGQPVPSTGDKIESVYVTFLASQTIKTVKKSFMPKTDPKKEAKDRKRKVFLILKILILFLDSRVEKDRKAI